ncbi:hypothetical protein TcasGA2_TC002196 [Tribolium castaneum]|uniref:Uncharacterized protein n=1 Tax=Tribolium castaneum TaxID=7070 RepID=D6WY63_TRICA|nr:hypothetical protein TcasGA2_TC002196 [Tribolium castaneum]
MATMATKKRITKAQFKLYLDFLRDCRPFARTGRLEPKDDPGHQRLERASKLITHVFTEWKCATRKMFIDNKHLNEYENELIILTGSVAVEGVKNTELGQDLPTTSDVAADQINY